MISRSARAAAVALAISPAVALAAVACVPSGNAPPYDAGASAPTSAPTFHPSIGIMTAAFEDDFERDGAAGKATATAPSMEAGARLLAVDARADAARHPLGDAAHESTEASAAASAAPDAADEDTTALGPDWTAVRTSAWRIEDGKLCAEKAHNHGVWLNRTLPVNARIEFDATAFTPDGDLKAEIWGDGRSAATGVSYTNATSYLVILGGWKNSIHAIARLNEHGKDRKEIHVDTTSDDPRQRAVVPSQTYHFKIERTDGKTVRWFVDGVEMLSFTDASPLAGRGHDHFGFNEWEAKVCFDNVKVTPL